jgi:hypothetical protein
MNAMSIVERVRRASAASMWVRATLLGALAISVTVGGVLAGAWVVAPVVARATRPDASAQFAQALTQVATTSRATLDRAREMTMNAVAHAPAPVTKFAIPAIAVVAIVGALSTLFLRRRTPSRTLPGAMVEVPVRSSISKLTPRSSARVSGKKQRTPRAVEALAASGASASDIAWRTGLPIDAVQLLLSISTGSRQLQPPTA